MEKKDMHLLLLLLGLVVITMPFPPTVNAWAILTFTLWNFWIKRQYKTIPSAAYRNFYIIALLYCLIMVLGFINTSNILPGLKLFEARYAIILFPLVAFWTGHLWKKQWVENIFVLFSIVSIVCALITQGGLIVDLVKEGRPYSDFFYWRYSNMDLSYRIGMHPTYLSMYALFSIIIIYKFWISSNFSYGKFMAGYLAIAYLIIFVLHLASKISLLVLGVILIIIVFQAFKQFRFRFLLALAPIAVVLGVLFNLEIFAMKSRLESSYTSDIIKELFSTDHQINPDDHRRIAWKNSLEIIGDNLLFGVGTGDVMDELYMKYRSEANSEFLIENEINSHNQFLEGLLRNGIPGLIALILLYYWAFQRIRTRDAVYLSFIAIITMVSFTENILDRQKGAAFFGIFNTLLFIYHRTTRNNNEGSESNSSS